jgi:hypothetical protein
MRRTLLLVLCLLVATFAHAASDLEILSFTADKTTVESGGDVTLTIRIRNNGPDAATAANYNLGNNYGENVLLLAPTSATNGWTCSNDFPHCFSLSVPAGSETVITMHVTTPPAVRSETFRFEWFGSASNESTTTNNRGLLELPLTPSDHIADLSLAVTAPPNPIGRNTQVTLAYDIRNNGPHDLTGIRVPVSINGALQIGQSYSGEGWTCTQRDAYNATCARPSLAAGASAPLTVTFVTPSYDLLMSAYAAVYSTQAHLDPNHANSEAARSLSIGNVADWSRLLAPITVTDVAGAHGSLWKTEVSALIESDTRVTIVPEGCGPVEDPCAYPPQNHVFDAFEQTIVTGDDPQFVYVPKQDAAKVSLATRVYDASKSETTAGAFVPTARDGDFREDPFSLIAVPSGARFRSTLRLYEYDGRERSLVRVSLYGDDEAIPFDERTVQLKSGGGVLTFALLPYRPGYAQLDLSSLIPAHYDRVRVRVAAVDAGLKLWGFASITNNETSHVTVIAP